ncbi:MAG TPA: hypothetical protein VFW23_17455 [Tepidisphaeraceae bacterium]|nr:hypothetical protein [Tepidisphaeraceae bacterium]
MLSLFPESVSTKIEIAWPLNVPASLTDLDLREELRVGQCYKDATALDHSVKIHENIFAARIVQQKALIRLYADTIDLKQESCFSIKWGNRVW